MFYHDTVRTLTSLQQLSLRALALKRASRFWDHSGCFDLPREEDGMSLETYDLACAENIDREVARGIRNVAQVSGDTPFEETVVHLYMGFATKYGCDTTVPNAQLSALIRDVGDWLGQQSMRTMDLSGSSRPAGFSFYSS